MLSVEEARERIVSDLQPLAAESASLLSALGRVCAEEVVAERRLPAFDNSAMDGYAVRAADTVAAGPDRPVELDVVELIAAGAVPTIPIGGGMAARIFTGAPVPSGADAVVMQEETRQQAGVVSVLASVPVGNNVRPAGSDVEAGGPVLTSGTLVGPGQLAMLAAQGRSSLSVHRQPRVAIVPTGNELVEVDRPVGAGQIPNTNSVLLAAQTLEAGGLPIRMPIVADEPEVLARRLSEAAASADLILTCGGVSVGDFDLVRDVLGQQGDIDFWRVAIKPGKPLAYGRLQGTPLLGLPGNPVSAFVCFELFARPAMRRLAAHRALYRPPRKARLAREVRPNKERREFLRATLAHQDADLVATPAGKQGSGQMTSLLRADALIDLPPGDTIVAADEVVTVLVLQDPSGNA